MQSPWLANVQLCALLANVWLARPFELSASQTSRRDARATDSDFKENDFQTCGRFSRAEPLARPDCGATGRFAGMRQKDSRDALMRQFCNGFPATSGPNTYFRFRESIF